MGKSPVSSRHFLQFAHFCCSPLFFSFNVPHETSEQQTADPEVSLKVMASIVAWLSSFPGGALGGSSSSLQIKRQCCCVTWSGDQWHGRGNESCDGRGRPLGFCSCSLHAGGGWDLRGVLSAEASVAKKTPGGRGGAFYQKASNISSIKTRRSGLSSANKNFTLERAWFVTEERRRKQ